MRRFTREELLIGGEPEIVDCLLQAARAAAIFRAKTGGRVSTICHRGSAMHNLERAYKMLLANGVDVTSIPKRGTSGDRVRQEAAETIQKRIVERLLEMNRR
jgi:hypothetical protein